MRWTAIAPALLLAGLAGSARADDAEDFDRDVAPILARRCLGCHSGAEPKGGLDLSRRASALEGGESGVPAVEPGSPGESLLWEHVESGLMPPKDPLPGDEAAALRDWIARGAPWGTDPIDAFRFTTAKRAGRDWWSLAPVRRPGPPGVSGGGWARNPIDAFLLARLESSGLRPSPEADRTALIRRLAFDLTGLPPTPEEVGRFLDDESPEAYERLVDRYLDSPEYGVRWARWWLDLARFGETNGFEFDEFRENAWPYRDWVVEALNRDLPYDEFARLQLAGDVLRPEDPRAVEATGFLVAGAYDSVGQQQQSLAMRKVVRQDELEDVVGTVSQTFLGLTANCARCHDHKFDPIRQEEYYRLASALSGVRHGERDLTPLDPAARAARRAIAERLARVAEIEAPARARLASAAVEPPRPLARWDFDRGLEDLAGGLDGTPSGDAGLSAEGLRLGGGTGYVATAPLATSLTAKTLEAWVRLDTLDQGGGGVMSVQAPGGGVFDAIVFAEREPRRWMAGSEGFARYRSFDAPEEAEATGRLVHLAITFTEDGTIAAYRDGRPYGTPYRPGPVRRFEAGRAQVLFGLRHGTPGGNRMLAGLIARARLYDRALTPEEVAASAAAGGPIPEEALAGALPPEAFAERARLLDEVARLGESRPPTRRAYCVAPSEPEVTHLLIRGNTTQPGEPVRPGGIAALAGLDADFGLAPDAPEADRRARLAAWITDPRNPLFARVAVNRLWQAHFGAGLVETSSDLGFNGGVPSHPELLDWLASELVERGWSLKAIHRLIVTSSAYRQSTRPDPEALRLDGSNRLAWRKSPTRLEAEMVRDAMLAVSGALDHRRGGPGFREFLVQKAEGTTAHLYPAIPGFEPGMARRTLYRSWARNGRSGFLDVLDCPDPSTTAPRRAVTTTPLQALTLLHDELTFALADRLADRLRREAGDDPGAQVDRAYRLAFARPPDADERALSLRLIDAHGLEAFARAVFNSNEFLYVD
jgi:hypothetical protein